MAKMPSHIFIVGTSRSGTKFLMNTLNSHSTVNISPETHWFSSLIHRGFIKTAKQIGDLQNDANMKLLIDKMYSRNIFGTFWKDPPVERVALERRFLRSDRSFRSLFAELMAEHQRANSKAIAGEKTPSHVFHIKKLLEWFPQARVIQMIRDPRAVLASEIHKDVKPDYPLKKKNLFYNLGLVLAVSCSWYLAIGIDRRSSQLYPERYISVRYEDLLNKHQQTVERVCQFLNISFEAGMLNPPRVDSSFEKMPIAGEAQNELSDWMRKSIEILLRRKMSLYDY